MAHLKVILFVLLGIFAKSHGGGWGSRGQGQGYPNRNNWRPQWGNNNNRGHQHQRNQNGANGHEHSLQSEPPSCSRPVFTDDAKLVIEKCERERFQKPCWDSSSKIPSGWKVFMDCRLGSSIIKYPSTCSDSGEWSPQLYNDCNLLLQEVQSKPLMNEGQCIMLEINVSENFLFVCFLPNAGLEATDCKLLKSKVPSGTTAMLKCKPPFHSQDGRDSEYKCHEGSWKGDFTHRLKCYYAPESSSSTNDHITTDKPAVQATVLPVTLKTTIRPRTTLSTTIKPITQRPTTTFATTAPVIRTKAPTQRPKPSTIPPSQSAVTCPALTTRSPGIKLDCVSKLPSGSVTVGCDFPQPIGAEVSYSCNPHYESILYSTLYRKCKVDGTYTGSAESFNCVVQCGKNNPVFVPFITSGTPSFRGQWPWHAAMFLKENFDSTIKWTYICGGTLISRRAILTASHCVTFIQSAKVRDPSSFRLDLGRFERETTDDIVQAKQVSSIHAHPSYSPFGYDSDIAIIILKDDVTIGYHVRPICFPQTLNSALEELQLSESSVGTVAGWGYNENSELASVLHMAELKVGSQKQCSESARGIETGSIQAKSTTFCARSKNGTADVNVCNGDSGGGIYFPLKNSDFTRWYLQGIVSVGVADEHGKCKPSQYSIFTRVGRYADWIVRVLSENDAL